MQRGYAVFIIRICKQAVEILKSPEVPDIRDILKSLGGIILVTTTNPFGVVTNDGIRLNRTFDRVTVETVVGLFKKKTVEQ